MDFFKEIITIYGAKIIEIAVCALFAYVGVMAKKLYTKYINDETKKSVIKSCVSAVEQIYKDLHGEDKFQKALEKASALLSEKNISVSNEEMKVLIESAVSEFNDAFKKTTVE